MADFRHDTSSQLRGGADRRGLYDLREMGGSNTRNGRGEAQAAAGRRTDRWPLWQATRATTIHTHRDLVWPWLVQMGYPTHRAGWYTLAGWTG